MGIYGATEWVCVYLFVDFTPYLLIWCSVFFVCAMRCFLVELVILMSVNLIEAFENAYKNEK